MGFKFYILVIISYYVPTPVNSITKKGFPGEASVSPFPSNQWTENKIVSNFMYSMDSDNIGFEFGMFEKQYGMNARMEDCTYVKLSRSRSDMICLVEPNGASNTTYSLRRFRIGYDSNNKKPNSNFGSLGSLDLNMKKMKYRLYPGDIYRDLYIVSSSYDPQTSKTTIFISKIKVDDDSINVQFTKTAGDVIANGMFVFGGSTKVSSNCNNLFIAINWVNTSLPLVKSATQVTNNIGIFINTDANNVYASISVIKAPDQGDPPALIFDLECEFNNQVAWIFFKDSPSSELGVYLSNMKVELTTSGVAFQLNPPFLSSIKIDDTKITSNFYHFAHLRDRQNDNLNHFLIICHIGNYIVPKEFDSSGLIDHGLPMFMRPKEPTEISTQKAGFAAYTFNIKHKVNGKLLYLDILSSFKTSTNKGKLLGTFYKRLTLVFCEHAFSLPTSDEELNDIHEKDGKIFYYVCVDQHFITVGYQPDFLESSYEYISFFSEPMISPKSSYINSFEAVSSTKISEQEATFNSNGSPFQVDFVPLTDNYFEYPISLLQTSGTLSAEKLSFENAPLANTSILGPNVSLKVTNLIPGIDVFNNKIHNLVFTRSEKNPISDANEVFFLKSAAVFEEHNKKAGVLYCSDIANYKQGVSILTCKEITAVLVPGAKVISTIDYTEKCGSIMIAVLSQTENKNYFYFFDLNENTIYLISSTEKRDGILMDCKGYVFVVLTWITDKDDPVIEIVFNKQTKSYIDSSSASGIGFKTNSNIRSLNSIPSDSNILFTKSTYFPFPNTIAITGFYFNFVDSKFEKYETIFRSVGILGFNEPQMCFFVNSYIIFPSTLLPTTIISAYLGDGSLSKNYETVRKINLSKIGFSSVKKLMCHGLKSADAFSVYGEQIVEVPNGNGAKVTNSLIVTFMLIDEPQQRIYNIMNTTKMFLKVSVTDDRISSIIFDLKEFSLSEYLRVQITNFPLAFYFGNLNQDKATLNILAFNNETSKSSNYELSISFTNAQSINVVPKERIDYKKDIVLSVSEMIQSIVGNVLKIDLLPGNGGVQVSSQRSQLELTLPAESVLGSNIQKGTSIVSLQTTADVTVFYISLEKKFLFMKSGSLICACSTGLNTDPTFFRASLSVNHQNKIYVVFTGPSNVLYSLNADYSLKTCGTADELTKNANSQSTKIVVNSLQQYIIYSNPSIPSTKNQEFVIAILEREQEITYYLSTTSLSQMNPRRVVDFNLIELQKWRAINVSRIAFCHTIDNGKLGKPELLVVSICLMYKEQSAILPNQLLIINHQPTETSYQFSCFSLVLPTSVLTAELDGFKCGFVTDSLISCACQDKIFNVQTFDLIRLTTQSQSCSNPVSTYCLSVDTSSAVKLKKESLYAPFGFIHNGLFTVLISQKKNGQSLLDNIYVMVYKRGSPYIYIGFDFESVNQREKLSFGFISANQFFLMNSQNYGIKIFKIDEMKLKFNADQLQNQNFGFLKFSNNIPDSKNQEINLTAIFKSQLPVNSSQKQNTSVLGSISKYWIPIVIVSVIAAILIFISLYYYIKRENLKKELAMKNDTVLTNLEEFYYDKRT